MFPYVSDITFFKGEKDFNFIRKPDLAEETSKNLFKRINRHKKVKWINMISPL